MLLSADICASENIFPSVILLLNNRLPGPGKSEKLTRLEFCHNTPHTTSGCKRYASVYMRCASGRITCVDAICKRGATYRGRTYLHKKATQPVGLSGKHIAVDRLCGFFFCLSFGCNHLCLCRCIAHCCIVHVLCFGEDRRAEVCLLCNSLCRCF